MMRDRLLALVAGLLYPLAFAPFEWWPVLAVSLGLAYWTHYSAPSGKEALFRGWLYGLGLFGFGVCWVHVSMNEYGFMPMWMAVPFTAAFAALLALYYGITFSLSWKLGRSVAAFAGIWLLVDWLRGWALTGFPWLYAGYALIDTPLAELAPLGGIWLVTLAAVIISATVVAFVIRRGRVPFGLTATALLIAAALWLPTQSFTVQQGVPQKVALIQGNIPQDLKWLTSMQAANRHIYRDLSEPIPGGTMVIWPESAMTEFYQQIQDFIDSEGAKQEARGSALISGLPWRSENDWGVSYHNSIAVVGGGEGVYHKQKLVPFGEYVPLQALLRGLIPFFDLPMSSFTPGNPTQPNLKALGQVVAPFICYEILYPELVAHRSRDSDVLLTISNDAWFGSSAGPHQHFQMARMRALETGRWLLRATNNGITAVVSPEGDVQSILPQFKRTVLLSEYVPRQGTTPFMATGVWPWLLLSLLMVAGAAYRHRNTRTATRQQPDTL